MQFGLATFQAGALRAEAKFAEGRQEPATHLLRLEAGARG